MQPNLFSFAAALPVPSVEAVLLGSEDGASPVPDRATLEKAARLLEDSGGFRIIRRLEPRAIEPFSSACGRGIALLLDTETTGLDLASAEIVELAMLAVSYDESGLHDVVGAFEGLRQPSHPLSADVVRLTGLTDGDLAGRSIDAEAVTAFASKADIVVAHNAGFDRAFVEAAFPVFRNMRWACSATEIPWRSYGAEGARLGQLLQACGLFHDGHRALADCHALLEILARAPNGRTRVPFLDLLQASRCTTAEIRAVGAPFPMKDTLKSRGYRWKEGPDGTKAWTIDVSDDRLDGELEFLREVVYRRRAEIPVRIRGARDRFRSS